MPKNLLVLALVVVALVGVGALLLHENAPRGTSLEGPRPTRAPEAPDEPSLSRPPTRPSAPEAVATDRHVAVVSEETKPAAVAAPERPAREPGGSVTVTVTDAGGNPIPAASVDLHRVPERGSIDRRTSRPAGDARRSGRTDADGRYVFDDLDLAEFWIRAAPEGFAPNLSRVVALSEAEPDTSLRLELSAGGRIVGRLLDVHGQPAEGIALSLIPDLDRTAPSPLDFRRGPTAEDGTFAFEHLTPGTWRLLTRATGSAVELVPEQTLTLAVFEGETTEARFKDITDTAVRVSGRILMNGAPLPSSLVSARRSDEAGLLLGRKARTDDDGRFQLTLDEGGDYRFQVSARPRNTSVFVEVTIPDTPRHELLLDLSTGELSGTVYATSGEPVVGAMVMAISARGNGERSSSSIGRAQTDQNGRYTISDLAPGTYRINAQLIDATATPFQRAASSDEVTVAAGESLTGVDVHLLAGASIEGRTLDQNGQPVAGARIEVRGGRGGNATSDDDGEFTVTGVDAQTTWLRASRADLTSHWTAVEPVIETATEVELVMIPGARVVARVEDADGPVEKAFVDLETDGETTALFIIVNAGTGTAPAVPAGDYRVIVRRSWRDEKVPEDAILLSVRGGEEHVLELRLP